MPVQQQLPLIPLQMRGNRLSISNFKMCAASRLSVF